MKKGTYIRKGRLYSVEEILPLIKVARNSNHSAIRIMLDGDLINIRSSRLDTFKKGVKCVCCGAVGVYFVKERHANMNGKSGGFFHLNLYALDGDWEEILMTSDHIVPRCHQRGLRNNRQTMCCRCNHAKGSRQISNEELARELGY